MWGDLTINLLGFVIFIPIKSVIQAKKLLFMGNEFGQFLEWKYDYQLEWVNLEDDLNKKMQDFTSQLNAFYKEHNVLWQIDDNYDGIEIIDADNTDQTVLSFIRKNKDGDMLICVFNMEPVERKDFTIGVPVAGIYEGSLEYRNGRIWWCLERT